MFWKSRNSLRSLVVIMGVLAAVVVGCDLVENDPSPTDPATSAALKATYGDEDGELFTYY
ncbi:hypothetical protein GF339_18170, partial [candidate division KSB3 bacterium]|nr:hypothetical protein [candidate division KSB3 bacterium]MBD3326516.1 hypothetical protein [candidate division KSB3 bacterium]